jgi:hypothetical protein
MRYKARTLLCGRYGFEIINNESVKRLRFQGTLHENFHYPSNGTVYWLSLLLTGLRKAGAQAFVMGHGRHPYCFLWRIIYGL